MRWLLLGKKAMTNLGNILKNRDITLYRQSSVQSSYGLPSGHLRLWELDHKEGRATKNRCLWMVVLDSLRVPWAAGRSNQSILKGNNPEYSLEWLMLGLKLLYFGHLMWTANSLKKSLKLGKIEARRWRGHQRIRWLNSITDAMDMNLGKFWEMVRKRQAWLVIVHGVINSWTWLGNSTAIIFQCIYVHHLHFYSFFCRWTLRLLPSLGYCKQCCNKHRLGCMYPFRPYFSSGIHPGVRLQGHRFS